MNTNTTNNKVAFAALAISLAASTLAAPQAFAGQRLIVPATVCVPHAGSANDAKYLQYSVHGRLFNTHPSKKLSVVCPVQRHNQSKDINWLAVYYDDNNPVGGSQNTIACRLRSNSAFGGASHDFSSLVQTSTSGGNYHGRWQFSGVQAVNNQSYYPFNYTLTCSLPPKHGNTTSSIGSIVFEEKQ